MAKKKTGKGAPPASPADPNAPAANSAPPAAPSNPPAPTPAANTPTPPAASAAKGPAVKFDTIVQKLPRSKWLERASGLSVRVYVPQVPFSLTTPEGEIDGAAGSRVVVRHDGQRVVVAEADFAQAFTFVREG